MRIVVANTVGRLENGKHVIAFPSRCDYAGDRHWFSYYPYEPAYLSALLKRDTDHQVTMVDGNHEQLGADEYIARLKPLKPDYLITECSALTYSAMTKVMQGLGAYSILTGPYGMYAPEQALADGWNEVISGEYEHKVLASLGGDPTPTGYIDLDWLPWPEDRDISRIEYTESSNPLSGMIQVYPSRGCPLSCTFCVAPMYYGGHGKSYKSHRTRDIHDVCDEIEYLAKKYDGPFSGCFFNEETHNANVDWLVSFAELLISRGLNKYSYDAMCGYWTFTEELVELLARAGYINIRIGIESLSRKVGKATKKVVFEDKLIRLMEWCKKYGIKVYGTSQIGAPGSTFQADIATLQALWELKHDGLLHRWQHSVSTPQPGTPFYDAVKRQGYLITDDFSNYNWLEPVMEWPDYKADDIRLAKGIYSKYAPVD